MVRNNVSSSQAARRSAAKARAKERAGATASSGNGRSGIDYSWFDLIDTDSEPDTASQSTSAQPKAKAKAKSKVPMSVYAAGDLHMLNRNCADCSRVTQSFCDGRGPNNQCYAQRRFPHETWAGPTQRTPFCTICEEIAPFCRFCRAEDLAEAGLRAAQRTVAQGGPEITPERVRDLGFAVTRTNHGNLFYNTSMADQYGLNQMDFEELMDNVLNTV